MYLIFLKAEEKIIVAYVNTKGRKKMAFSELAVLKSDSFQVPLHKDEYSLKIHFSMDCRGYTDL